jgi:hypothetical protein
MPFGGRRPSSIPPISKFEPELMVVDYVATKRSDPERGPQVRMSSANAKLRLLIDGELAWVRGSRGKQLAEVVVDDTVPDHGAVVRDVPGIVLSEMIRVAKPDMDSPERT